MKTVNFSDTMKSLIPTGLLLMCSGALFLPVAGSLWLFIGGFALTAMGVFTYSDNV